jgi:NAD(P)-dependent dehydrogenase (short-subunit alcohol dehydrogenase family)
VRLFLLYTNQPLKWALGGNSGIGKETVKALLSKRAKVYIASHNKERTEAAIQELKAATTNEAIFLELDLASLKSVKAAAETFQNLEGKLDVLINNACVL